MLVSKDLFGHTIVVDGNISSRCQVYSDNGTKYIMLDGGLTFHYQESDKVSKRMIWSEIYSTGFVTYKQAAKGAGVTSTTLKNWVKRFKAGGFAALQDKIGRGF